MKPSPPRLALRFLRWFCKDDRLDEVEGDLLELFEKRSSTHQKKANRLFVWDVLKSMRWVNLRRPAITSHMAVYSQYFKTGYRYMVQDARFSCINLFGLSLGLAVFIIMTMMVYQEMTFDHFHQKGERIFEVVQEFQRADGVEQSIFTSTRLSKALRDDLPMVENAVTIHGAASTWMTGNGKRLFEENGIVAGPQFFEIFDFPIKHGDPKQVLRNHGSIVLDENLATKLFGHSNPTGETVELERYGMFTVAGVMEQVPENSYLQFEFIITQDYHQYFTQVASWYPDWFQSWEGNGAATYLLLHDASQAATFQKAVRPLLEKYLGVSEPVNPHLLVNLLDLHFDSESIQGAVNQFVRGDRHQLRIFGLVAGFILLMACFNYINIVTARSLKRHTEIGIRKTMGAVTGHLRVQFLIESFLMVSFAMILAVGWIIWSLPFFNSITGIDLQLTTDFLLAVSPYLAGLLLIITVLAGGYPALYLSSYQPVTALANASVASRGNRNVRQVLVTLQYAMVLMVTVALLVVNQQYQLLSDQPRGFDTDQLVVVEINGGGVRNNFREMKQQLLSNPNISSVSGFTRMVSGYRDPISVYGKSDSEPANEHALYFYGADKDGVKTLNLKILKGRDFTGIRPLDSASVLLNSSAAARYGGSAIVGEWIDFRNQSESRHLRAKVIGIVQDFHFHSLHERIQPMVLGHYMNPFESLDDIVIRISGNDRVNTLKYIEQVHHQFDENDVMTWAFLDDMIQQAYEQEATFRRVFTGASILALIISILGIIGLISYHLVARTKEFGIRKAMGASYWQLLSLQLHPFLNPILLSLLVASPVVWFWATNWLDQFAYRVSLTPLPFSLAIALILLCTTLISWLLSHRAVRKNPVEALRYE